MMTTDTCAQAISDLDAAITPLVHAMTERIGAQAIGCARPWRLSCPRWQWYARLGAGHVTRAHVDVAGNHLDQWHNFWILLSPGVGDDPLVLLDPTESPLDDTPSYAHRRWAGSRALTYERMRTGDLVVWRSTKVAHASASHVELHQPGALGDSPRGVGRASLDVRCECVTAHAGEGDAGDQIQ